MSQHFIFLFVSSYLNANCNAQSFFFDNFVNIFQYFNYLWHNNDLFYNFFQNIRNLNELLFVWNDWDWSLFVSIDYLENFFNMVDISYNFFEFFHNNCFLDNFLNFSDCLIFVLNLNDFFVLSDDFFDLFDNNWNFNNLFNNFFDVFVDVNKLRNDSLNLNNFRNLDNYFFCSFNFLDFRNSDNFFDNFFRDELGCDDFLNNWLDWNNLFSFDSYFFDSFTDIRNFLNNLFHNLIDNDFFLNSNDFVDSNLFYSLSYDFLNNLRNLDDFLNDLSYWNDLFDDLFYWDRNLDRNNNLIFNFNWFGNFHSVIN